MKNWIMCTAAATILANASVCWAADYQLVCSEFNRSNRINADIVEVKSCSDDKASVKITYKFGIGASKLIFSGKGLPKVLQLDFKKFGNMESIEFSIGTKRIRTSLKRAPQVDETVMVPTGKNDSLVNSHSKYAILVKLKKDSVHVEIPCRELMGTEREIVVSWIDAYRN